jgi:hypothetical protein
VFVLAIAAFAVVVGVGARMASRVALPPGIRRPAQITRWLLVAVTIAGITTAAAGRQLAAGRTAIHTGVLIAGAGAVLLILLIALASDNDQRRARTATSDVP